MPVPYARCLVRLLYTAFCKAFFPARRMPDQGKHRSTLCYRRIPCYSRMTFLWPASCLFAPKTVSAREYRTLVRLHCLVHRELGSPFSRAGPHCLPGIFHACQSILAKITLSRPISLNAPPADLVNCILAKTAPTGARSVKPVNTCHWAVA